jgi:hypothetical protein
MRSLPLQASLSSLHFDHFLMADFVIPVSDTPARDLCNQHGPLCVDKPGVLQFEGCRQSILRNPLVLG